MREHPCPLTFVTISGAHLYGFPSPDSDSDSDSDLRGVHVLPPRDILGLDTGRETVEVSGVRDGLEIDLVTHDARKFFKLMLRRNGYVLEQLLTGIHLMRTGNVEANLVTLNEEYRLPGIRELVQRKLAGPEHSTLDDAAAPGSMNGLPSEAVQKI